MEIWTSPDCKNSKIWTSSENVLLTLVGSDSRKVKSALVKISLFWQIWTSSDFLIFEIWTNPDLTFLMRMHLYILPCHSESK